MYFCELVSKFSEYVDSMASGHKFINVKQFRNQLLQARLLLIISL